MKEEHKIGYSFFRNVLGFVFKVYYRPKLINRENIPKDGPIIICGNHKHLFDQNLACISTKRMLHYMAKIEYFEDKRKAWFFKMAGCIPVNRKIHDHDASNHAVDLLKYGYAIGIFPEGTRNKTNEFLLPFKFGAVSMAQKTGASIVPFAITGEYRFRNNHLNIRFGKPFKVGKTTDLAKANDQLFNAISDLKKEGNKEIENGKI